MENRKIRFRKLQMLFKPIRLLGWCAMPHSVLYHNQHLQTLHCAISVMESAFKSLALSASWFKLQTDCNRMMSVQTRGCLHSTCRWCKGMVGTDSSLQTTASQLFHALPASDLPSSRSQLGRLVGAKAAHTSHQCSTPSLPGPFCVKQRLWSTLRSHVYNRVVTTNC